MPHNEDALDFKEEIRITQFWRQILGEESYHRFVPSDLRRWYEAMALMGPENLQDYLNERNSRFPRAEVTGLVSAQPHPPLWIVEAWLEAKGTGSHTVSLVSGLGAFTLFCGFIVAFFCHLPYAQMQQMAALVQNAPQKAVLITGQINAPQPLSTLPSVLPGMPSPYVGPTGVSVPSTQPTASTLTAQTGTAFSTSGSSLGNLGSQSTTSGMPGMPQGTVGGTPFGANTGITSPGPSAFAPSTATSTAAQSAQTGSSSNITGLSSSGH